MCFKELFNSLSLCKTCTTTFQDGDFRHSGSCNPFPSYKAMLRPITQKTFLPCCEYLLRKPLLPCCGLLTHKTVPLCFGGLARTVFADAFRQKKLDSITVFEENERAELPIRWSGGQLELMEASLRRKLRSVDFFIEVRDARIPASTLHPQLRRWAGKKPKILVFNRSDMITHKERMEWERHLEERNLKANAFVLCFLEGRG